MLSFKNFLYAHWLILAGGFSLALLVASPLIAFPFAAGDAYRGINIAHFGGDEHTYLARAKEVLEGHNLGSAVLREGKNAQDPFFMYNERVLLLPITLLKLGEQVNTATLYNIYNFIGVFILILLIYFFVYQLTEDKLLSVLSALSAIGGYSMVFNKTLFYSDFNIYGRAMFPYISSIGFLGYLNLLVNSLKSQKWKYKIFAGLAFGALFYIYFFAWSFVAAFNGILIAIFLLRKDFASFKTVFFVSGLGVTIGLYNLIKLFFLYPPHDLAQQFYYFHKLTYGHFGVWSNALFIASIFYIFYFYRRKFNLDSLVFLALLLAGWVSLNQQMLTGRAVEYNHYYWYFVVPVSIVIALASSWAFLGRRHYQILFFMAVVAIVYMNTAVGQYRSFVVTFEAKKYEQNFAPIIEALNRDKTPSVILAAGDTNELLFVIYTPHDLFWHDFALLDIKPIVARAKDALFVYLYLNRTARADFKGYLHKIMADNNYGSFEKEAYKNIEGFSSGLEHNDYTYNVVFNEKIIGQKREETINSLDKEFSRFAEKSSNVENTLQKYGVNYIVWDKNKNPDWDLSFIGGLKEMARNNGIYLYKISY